MKTYRNRMFLMCLVATLTAATALATDGDTPKYEPRDGVIRLYGAGGPHTAIIPVGELFTKKTGIPVEVIFGPESKWTKDAQRNADIIWGTSEQSMTAYLESYKEFKSHEVEPIFIKRAVIAVQKGNPKSIK